MKTSKFVEERIAYALKQTETGAMIKEVCRTMRPRTPPPENRRGSTAAWLFRATAPETTGEESRLLKQMPADISLDEVMLRKGARKSSKARMQARTNAISDIDSYINGQHPEQSCARNRRLLLLDKIPEKWTSRS